MSSGTIADSLSDVKPGDVLVSHSTTVRHHEISVIPGAPHAVPPTHDIPAATVQKQTPWALMPG